MQSYGLMNDLCNVHFDYIFCSRTLQFRDENIDFTLAYYRSDGIIIWFVELGYRRFHSLPETALTYRIQVVLSTFITIYTLPRRFKYRPGGRIFISLLIFSLRFHRVFPAFLFAISFVLDSSMTSNNFRPFLRRVEPVSVRSTYHIYKFRDFGFRGADRK